MHIEGTVQDRNSISGLAHLVQVGVWNGASDGLFLKVGRWVNVGLVWSDQKKCFSSFFIKGSFQIVCSLFLKSVCQHFTHADKKEIPRNKN